MITQIANSRFRRPLCYFSASLMLTLGLPMNLFAYDPNKPVNVKEKKKTPIVSRALTAEEMDSFSGRSGNPYYAGQAKFDVVYKGVNLRTGNYSTSATDLSFEGGYGIPVNITRSYSVNNIDEGPFGVGWTLSADLRSTAGGLLKSSKAPVRSVPTGMKRRPTSEDDPNIPTDPVEAVIVTDADGKETTIQRDVDGVLTTPPWDKNEYETEYEYVDDGNGNLFWVLKANKTMTPDGTVYQYEKKGEYINGGSKRWDDTSTTPVREPNNVLKPVWVKDRHENTTTYTYGSTDVQFVKANGTVAEKPLIGVAMPNGRNIELTWSGSKVTEIRAYSSAEERKVLYGYTNNCLTSVQQVRTMSGQSAEYGRINRYGYYGNLLTSMTDPRGLTTTITYTDNIYINSTAYQSDALHVATISYPNGLVENFYSGTSNGIPYGSVVSNYSSTTTNYRVVASFTSGTSSMRVDEETDNVGIIDYGSNVPNYGLEDGDATQAATQKYFDNISQNLVEQQLGVNHTEYENVTIGNWVYPVISKTISTYNFFGNPLKEDKYEYAWPTISGPGAETRHITTETAYWGEDKYFQQKAVKVSASGLATRYSYTDYYDSSAAQGSKGQTSRVYDAENGGIDPDYFDSSVVPSYGTGYAWKYRIRPTDLDKYSAKFEYDSKGRPTDVWKLQKVVSGTYNYVQTKSVYGADNAPAYGNATQVTEDYGGASARTTQTLAFDLLGKEVQTADAASRTYSTTYDVDGNVLSVDQGSQNVVSCTYGTTDATVENGQPLSITDGLSGVEQDISYVQSGAAKGMPATIDEDAGGGQTTSTTYTYDDRGNRETSTITTPNGTTRYKYSKYGFHGVGTNVSWAFSKINKQKLVSGNWVDSDEEVQYRFNGLGQLKKAYFAMTPQSGQDDYNTYDPYSFVSAEYDYDSAGRTTSVKHYWNELVSGNYEKEAIRGSTASYSHPLGLKTSTSFLTGIGSTTSWTVDRTEEYGYNSKFDYLTDVDYNDGLSNEVQSWAYDAAGNRTSDSANAGTWTYDNLNRMSASPGTTYTHDAVGNRLTKVVGSSSTSYGWDAVNRMVETGPTSGSKNQYKYRADGMRVRKTGGGVTESVYYDGQMPVETFEDASGTANDVLTQNFVGVRGIEMMENSTSTGVTKSYPLYDIHGNMVNTLSTFGTSWSTANPRSYDVWGSVRSGSATGGPKGRYVANLGHVQDDESGLVYMRARYYESGTGRFVSEDRQRDGLNWYSYCGSDPVNYADESGHSREYVQLWGLVSITLAVYAVITAFFEMVVVTNILLLAATFAAVNALEDTGYDDYAPDVFGKRWMATTALAFGALALVAESLARLSKLPNGMVASIAVATYLVTLWAAVIWALNTFMDE